MIINNGYYQFELNIGGGEDEQGRPLQTTAQWSTPAPCRISTNNDNRRARNEDGTFHDATYTMTFDGLLSFPYKRVRLERLGEQLGEYKVVSSEQLEAVQATRVVLSK